MPSLAQRGGRHRRTVNEINMVPFIDVMLVLLIIFMVSAPLITVGQIELPSVGQAKAPPPRVIEVVVHDDLQGSGGLTLRVDGQDAGTVALADLAAQVQVRQNDAPGGEPAKVPVIISARKDVHYETVVKVMDTLQRAGVQRVGLAVRTTGSAGR